MVAQGLILLYLSLLFLEYAIFTIKDIFIVPIFSLRRLYASIGNLKENFYLRLQNLNLS